MPDGIIKRVIQYARQGYTTLEFDNLRHRLGVGGLSHRFGPELEQFRAPTDAFLQAVENDGEWSLNRRLDGKIAKTMKARDLWEKIGYAAWASADPGLQYHTTINDWHTCPESGPIRASNPCSEYMFLDDTACNLASLNLLQFRDNDDQGVRRQRLRARYSPLDADARDLGRDGAVPLEGDRAPVVRLPHARPRLRQRRRHADASGMPYDSDHGRAICGALTAILTGRAYKTSAEIAAERRLPRPQGERARTCCA